jgi:DNA-binding NarL/FixJ family response regulator
MGRRCRAAQIVHESAGRRGATWGDVMTSIRVLLVDDNVEFVEQVAAFLSDLPGYVVAARAHAGVQAVDLAKDGAVDLVVMDVSMPGMNGLEATSRIKARAHAPLVVIASLYDSAEYRTAADAAGADGFLSKDDLVTGLPALVERLWKGRRVS